MRQTASGRWVPDKPPPEPEPDLPPDLSFDSYMFHAYAHPTAGKPGCGWCYLEEHPPKPIGEPPWDVLGNIELR